ncbi:MAG: prepilin peptidase [Candidatus Margulisbacteria bacterium]|nr:prepilin peptidase [Candidatus Margulisiibacteriota bacterium]
METILLFILGSIIGSFLNVCIYRLPRNESIVLPPSHCPSCGNKLGIIDLIPLASYLLLGGKCRFCKKKIVLRYLLVELISGLFLIWLNLLAPLWVQPANFIFTAIFFYLLLLIFFIDAENQVIPDSLNVGLIFLGLVFNLAQGAVLSTAGISLNPIFSAVAGMGLGFIILWLIGFWGKIWFKKPAMGEGDIFLAAALGACLGWRGVLVAIFLAYLLAAAVAVYLLLSRKAKFGQYIPFGPALAGAGILALLFGERIIAWYWQLFL